MNFSYGSAVLLLLAGVVLSASPLASARTMESGPVKELQASNTSCTICEYTMSVLQTLVSENSTEEEMIKLLDDFCEKFMPSTIKQVCDEFVANYGHAVIQLLAQKLEPQVICRELKLCPRTSSLGSRKPLPRVAGMRLH